jgi:hypothetical protein
MIYATATGRSVEDVTLAQLRYRLCETRPARRRVRRRDAAGPRSTGGSANPPKDAELGIFRWIEIRQAGTRCLPRCAARTTRCVRIRHYTTGSSKVTGLG